MIETKVIKINKINKLTFLKYTSYLIKKFDFSKSNKDITNINNNINFLKKVQEFPLEPDKFIITKTEEKIKNNNNININDSICFCKKGFSQELISLVRNVINDSDSHQEKIKLTQEIDIENDIASFMIKESVTENTILGLSFKNTNKEKLKEIKDWLDEIAKYANQIIDLKNKSLEGAYKLNSESKKDIQNPSNIEKNSCYDEIKECIAKINSPNKICSLFYIIKKQIKEKNIRVKNDNFEIEGLYNISREIEGSIEFLKKLNNDSSVLQNQNDKEILVKIHNYINSLSDKDLLIKILGNIVEKASSILDIMKKNSESITLGQLIKEDVDLNKLKTIMNSSKEYFFNKEKAQKPEDIIDNNEYTSKKRMINEDNCYEHNNKKPKKSDTLHIKDKKISPEIKQPIEYSEEKSTKEGNNKTNELHSSEFQFTCYIYPRFNGIKSVKIPNK